MFIFQINLNFTAGVFQITLKLKYRLFENNIRINMFHFLLQIT